MSEQLYLYNHTSDTTSNESRLAYILVTLNLNLKYS